MSRSTVHHHAGKRRAFNARDHGTPRPRELSLAIVEGVLTTVPSGHRKGGRNLASGATPLSGIVPIGPAVIREPSAQGRPRLSRPLWGPTGQFNTACTRCAAKGETYMATIERRTFVKGATLGALAFTVGGSTVLLTPGQARAGNVPFRLLKPRLRPISLERSATRSCRARAPPASRISSTTRFRSRPRRRCCEARILNVRPPFANFYRAALGAIDRASQARLRLRSSPSSRPPSSDEFVDNMRQNKIEGWQGPPAAVRLHRPAQRRRRRRLRHDGGLRARSAFPTWPISRRRKRW